MYHLSLFIIPTHSPSYAPHSPSLFLFFFNDTATTEIYTLSLHDALPIYVVLEDVGAFEGAQQRHGNDGGGDGGREGRSEEHTSELQSRENLVCRLLLEKKKRKNETKIDGLNQSNGGLKNQGCREYRSIHR